MRASSPAMLITTGGGGGSLTDGDKGDVSVSGGGALIQIDNNAVTTAKIANNAVTTAKIPNDAVTLPKIANGTPGRYIGFDVTGEPTELTAPTTFIETLTVVSRNTINPLSFTPTSPVEFSVNGAAVRGITNVGTAVSVNATLLGFNVDPGVDVVTAQYSH